VAAVKRFVNISTSIGSARTAAAKASPPAPPRPSAKAAGGRREIRLAAGFE